MCGIIAVMRFDGQTVDEHQIVAARDTMFYRGPDDGGVYIDGSIGLGHRRLSIVDVTSAGHQPMANEDQTIWITFNGEIYNYLELRSELVARGHRFASTSDTEVIVHLYEEMGERCVERLGGMFAFVLWDARRRLFFGARDRVGIKSLQYYVDGHQFVAASEAKAILNTPGITCTPDHRAIADYCFAGFPLADRTAFAAIRQVPPGHSITVTSQGAQLRKYWDVTYQYDHQRSDVTTVEQLRTILEDSVRLHCRSDAELGCHLSGGLDSSTVTALSARHRTSLKTFSIRFDGGSWYDETAFARAVAESVGSHHFVATPDALDLARLLPRLLWHAEVPLSNTSGFSYFTVSRLAAKYVKVSLTGHGGDEVFAGYPAQFQTAFGIRPSPPSSETQRSLGQESVHVRIGRFLAKLRAGAAAGGFSRIAKRLMPRSHAEQWIALHCSDEPARSPLLDPGFVAGLGGYSPVSDYIAPFNEAPTAEILDRCLYHDLRSYLPGLLHMEDRMSMSVSVESRVPLLDHRLIEFMATVPPLKKVPGMVPKALLKAAAGNALPSSIRDRKDKRPFPVPLEAWMQGPLAALADDVLLSPQSLDRGVINADRLRRRALSSNETWTALNLELWSRIFIDRDPTWLEAARSAGSRV